MSYTKGPWAFVGRDTIIRPGNMTSDQADICYMNEEGGNASSDWFSDPEVVQADARLIAAAPDMLEALKAYVGVQNEVAACDCVLCEAVRMARAAIAKAEGKP